MGDIDLGKRYRLIRKLGEGGMAEVYLAEHTHLGRKEAIKVLHPHLGIQKEMAMRFQREAKATSMLNHPNSVTVYDFGAWKGQLFIASWDHEAAQAAIASAPARGATAAERD